MEAPVQEPRVAWEPLTWRGVAAFSGASLARLLVVQLVSAVAAGLTVAWFLHAAWSPILGSALSHLPPQSRIQAGVLEWPAESPTCLAEGHFLALVVDLKAEGGLRSPAHLQLDFGQTGFKIRSLLGDLAIKYPHDWSLALDEAQLQPWWGAWRPAILALAGGAVVSGLMASWMVLATLYCLPVWLVGYLADRELSLAGSWRLAGAALMPGAWLMTAAILIYGLGALDLVRLVAAGVAHFALGWLYLILSPLSLPRRQTPPPEPANPFAPPSPGAPEGP